MFYLSMWKFINFFKKKNSALYILNGFFDFWFFQKRAIDEFGVIM